MICIKSIESKHLVNKSTILDKVISENNELILIFEKVFKGLK